MPLKVMFTPPRFDAYTIKRGGHLPDLPGAHALFHYYVTARHNQEEEKGMVSIVFEGELDPIMNYRRLWKSIANLHGVDPNEMGNFWPAVDLQAQAMNLPLLIGEPRFDGKMGGKILLPN